MTDYVFSLNNSFYTEVVIVPCDDPEEMARKLKEAYNKTVTGQWQATSCNYSLIDTRRVKGQYLLDLACDD